MVTASEAAPHSHVGGIKDESVFPLFVANDGYTKQDGDGETTSTCFCGGVQYAFVSPSPPPNIRRVSEILEDYADPPHVPQQHQTAHSRPRNRRLLHLPLHRLPQSQR